MSRRALFTVISLAGALLLLLDIMLGSVNLSVREIFDAFTGSGSSMARDVVFDFRLPKAFVAILAGAALASAGLQMQTLFRNPLAGPYVLGISSGASLGVSLFLLGLPLLGPGAASTLVRNLGIVGSAWIGGALILMMVMAVSSRLKDIMAILILGIMVGSAAGAIVQILQYLSPDSALKSYVVWTMGSLGGVSKGQLSILAPLIAAGLILSVAVIKPLNILLLGENYARTMGVNVKRVRAMLFLSTTILAGSVTAFCGPIGFIGIAVPHVARMLFADADHRTLMPASILLGAVTMLLCDIISQLPGANMILPINTITALIGIPVVVLVIIRNRKIF